MEYGIGQLRMSRCIDWMVDWGSQYFKVKVWSIGLTNDCVTWGTLLTES